MPDLAEHYRVREALTAALAADVVGPALGERERLIEEPLSAYIAGVLHPRRRDRDAVREDTQEDDHDLAPSLLTVDENPDTGVSMANLQKPSAMGLTFSVDTAASDRVRVEVGAATYVSENAAGEPVEPRRAERRSVSVDEDRFWRRAPLTVEPVFVDVKHPGDRAVRLDGRGLELRIRVRRPAHDGVAGVTLSLVNTHTVGAGDLLDPWCYFQTRISVSTPRDVPALVDRSSLYASTDEETQASRLLQRHAPAFATGHGCAVDWSWTPPAPGSSELQDRASTSAIETVLVPVREVLLTDSNPEVAEPSMHELATASLPSVLSTLTDLVDQYDRWISRRRTEMERLHGTGFAGVAREHIDACSVAAARMRSGIERLSAPATPEVFVAFQWANEAMAQQRARTAWVRGGRGGRPDVRSGRWRPFQIGFILLCVDGIVDGDHPDRGLADLLWFPTGGGKTEAYLGLIAFTTFLRRLRHGAAGAGVTVLMRYTLRLLTLQQFERASTLICAMERIRQRGPDRLGDETIAIGMWVGRAATPNRLAEAQEGLDALSRGKSLQERNPVQLKNCPWCGTALDYLDYAVEAAALRMSITCRASDCEFRSGLPVHVVDETIYEARPTLVIATADKFAQMPWRAEVAELFNRAGALAGTPPPELVIQDELHLISGPLGSLAGLYETAIDHAAGRPKIIASTATIRRASAQGRHLFDREIRQFPPPGLDARDSWFSVEAPRERRATRQYVGLFAPGTSQATLLIRTYAALLHHARRIDTSETVRDAYWTLVGYFNSLRLLSAAELQVHADVVERLQRLKTRDGAEQRDIHQVRELTSRIESSEVPRYLKELFVALPSHDALDVVLATNMISVGVDVDRLGLMAVMGQPQTTAEYIQATSRVGRRDPGLVVTMLNAARSRDRSHYENFVPFHSALYRQVEPTSVTPYAARARDRALHAVLVGMLRAVHPIARPNDAARRVEDFLSEARATADLIVERAEAVAPDEVEGVARELTAFIERWRDLADAGSLVYEARRRRPGDRRAPDTALLRSYGQDEDLEEAQDTMWSLRDVDVESHLYLER